MTPIRFKRVSRWTPKHWSPHDNLVVQVNDQTFELESGHGTHDSISIFRDDVFVYVLVINSGLPYVGLAEYNIQDGQVERDDRNSYDCDDGPKTYRSLSECSQVFFQLDHELEDVFGPGDGWLELAPMELATKLREYLG
jgi:hypothetical protein